MVASRLVAPLFIPKHPLPAILLCLVLDASDREVLETFTHVDLSQYQGVDKALDIFYLTIARLAVLRNWTNGSAVQLARFLFYYRLVGVAIFEFIDWRPVLLIFPNTFEYFFIFYELVLSRWSVERISGRFFVAAAALIWVVIKLPQEYWIHVLHLDVTDLVKTEVFGVDENAPWADAVGHRPEALAIFVATALGLVVAVRSVVSALAPPPQKPRDLPPAPYPPNIDEPRARIIWIARFWRVFDSHLAEKIVLITLVTVIFAQTLPDLVVTTTEFVAGIAVVVTFNSFLTVRSARNGRLIQSAVWSFVLLALTNTGFAAVLTVLVGRRGDGINPAIALFFLLMLSLLVTMFDRFHPVYEARHAMTMQWEEQRGALPDATP